MDDYDSDSSLSDVDSAVSTNVLLGYATKDTTEDTFSRLGGQPEWLHPARHPPPQLVQCKSCNEYMALLLQLNGDLPTRFPGHERRLYVWACRRKACRRKPGSIRGVRGVRASKEADTPQQGSDATHSTTTTPKETTNVGNELFGANPTSGVPKTNPFSSNPPSSAQTNPFATAPGPTSSLAAKPPQKTSTPTTSPLSVQGLTEYFADKARISTSTASSTRTQPPPTATEPWPPSTAFQKSHPSYYLDADYEYLTPHSESGDHAAASSNGNYAGLMDLDSNPTYQDEEEGSAVSGTQSSTGRKASKDKDNPAKGQTSSVITDDSETPHDRAFLHFADTVAQNPEQVLRYEFGGTPLLYSRTDDVGRLLSRHDASAGTGVGVKATGNGGNGMPRCARCGAARCFELQLTPHAIAELEAEEEAATLLRDGMEWGTVLLGVCSADCARSAAGQGGLPEEQRVEYVEEWVGVQWEEVVDQRGGSSR